MAIRIVQSKQNARVKELRAAFLRPARVARDLVALEGIHLVTEAIASNLELITIFVAQGSERLLDHLSLSPDTEVLALPMDVLSSAVTTESPQPIAALARPQAWGWTNILGSDLTEPQRPRLLVVLARLQDPGNLGTILRSADAFGAHGIVCLIGTASAWNPKSVRASAGSLFRMPVLYTSETECFERLKTNKITAMAAMAHDAEPVQEADLTASIALIIGPEGSGLSPELASRCDSRVTIPCPGPVESLNAATAASILLYEAARQRSRQPAHSLPSNRRQSR